MKVCSGCGQNVQGCYSCPTCWHEKSAEPRLLESEQELLIAVYQKLCALPDGSGERVLAVWMCNVATEEQLDVPVPKCGGLTGRQLLAKYEGQW